MFIETLNFKEMDKNSNEWSINKFSFEKINLIVGKNSMGKSRTLNVISTLGKLVAGEKEFLNNGEFEVFFKNSPKEIEYFFEYKNSTIGKEKLIIDKKTLVDRGEDGIGKIYAEELKQEIKFQVPQTSLACVVRRDSIQHPYFEDLYNWGKSVRHYHFGSQLGKDHMVISTKKEQNISPDLKDTNSVVLFFKKGIEKYGEEFTNLLLSDINSIGYEITEIGIGPIRNVTLKNSESIIPQGIYIKEKGHLHTVDQTEISQGLFRAISLFIQLRYSEKFSEPSLILIDDIGEGLDYERSTLLISSIIKIIQKTNSQLIMTTNDRFVMNNVPLEYWCVLQRDGGKCFIINYRNSEEIFNEFELTGLNNFDFFSSQYYERKISG